MPKVPWYQQPAQKPPDIRDADEHAAVAAALEALPRDHQARAAYADGADTIALTHLVTDRRDIAHGGLPCRLSPQPPALGQVPPMTFARLILEIRRRAASLPNDLPRSIALEQAAREVLETAGQQREPARKIMTALLGLGGEQDFDASVLDALTPETVLRLDLIADQMFELGRKMRYARFGRLLSMA